MTEETPPENLPTLHELCQCGRVDAVKTKNCECEECGSNDQHPITRKEFATLHHAQRQADALERIAQELEERLK